MSVEAKASLAAESGRVIVAEDDDDLRHLIVLELRKDGHEVVEAASGAELADVVVKHAIFGGPSAKPADVIVSDVRMPGCSGLQVLADMRGRDWATPVVLMTAFADRHLKEAAQRLGAMVVFDKPIDLPGLRSFVGRMVREQREGDRLGKGEVME